MLKTLAAVAALALGLGVSACSSGTSAAQPTLTTSCQIVNGDSGFVMTVALSIATTTARIPSQHVTQLTVLLSGEIGLSSSKTVSESTNLTVPGTNVTGYAKGAQVSFPAPLLNGYLPGGCTVQSWS